jgi:hypothetical protein
MARMAAATGADDLAASISMTCEIQEACTVPPAAGASMKLRSDSIYYVDYLIADSTADVVRCGAEAEFTIAADRAMEAHNSNAS